ncbi:MAG: hypothetical protein Ct9H300mP12_13980 [Acidimicrobiales bacterium]|nr:MAG: hypothetical protein Ct9H300mP12_13980 [Acidimicrobiales bacterium]
MRGLRLTEPADDLVTGLVQAEVDGERLTRLSTRTFSNFWFSPVMRPPGRPSHTGAWLLPTTPNSGRQWSLTLAS